MIYGRGPNLLYINTIYIIILYCTYMYITSLYINSSFGRLFFSIHFFASYNMMLIYVYNFVHNSFRCIGPLCHDFEKIREKVQINWSFSWSNKYNTPEDLKPACHFLYICFLNQFIYTIVFLLQK